MEIKNSLFVLVLSAIPFSSGSGQADHHQSKAADNEQTVTEQVAELRKQITIHSVKDSMREYKERKIDSVHNQQNQAITQP